MIRLKEALLYANRNGKNYNKQEFAQLLWTDNKKPKSAYMNLLNLESGKSKTIDISQIAVICKECGVSADYLFGLTELPNYNASMQDRKNEVIAKATELIQAIQTI